MRHLRLLTLSAMLILTMSSCEKLLLGSDKEEDAVTVFEYLWQQVDERYSLFDVKNVDWQKVHDTLRPKVYEGITNDSLFSILSTMLNTLDDGHVNLWGNNDLAGSEEIFLQRYGKNNFDINTVALTYLRPNYHSTGGFAYNTIDSGRVLYIRYSSFSSSASTAQFSNVVGRYPDVDGIVLDIRQNGGGEIQNEWNMMALLPNHNKLLYSTQMKNGKGHYDFGPLTDVYAPKNDETIDPITKPLVLLTDRGCYSAASCFALCLKTYDNVTVIGDTTAGGLAIPAGGALPNGWYYRFGVSRTIAPDGVNYENGVPPDRVVLLDPAAVAAKRDNIIDSACRMISNH